MSTLSPFRSRDWGTVKLGDYVLGIYGYSCAVVKGCKSEVKKDSKKKAGKSSAKVTTQGLEQWKGTIVFQFLRGAWDEGQPGEAGEDEIGFSGIEATLNEIDPAGIHKGGPFPFEYPGLGPGAPKAVLITSMTRPIEWSGEIGSVTIEWCEASLESSAGAGLGTSSSATISAAERAALTARLAYLAALIVTKRAQMFAAGTSAERDIINSEIQGLQNEFNGIQSRLNAPPRPATPTETRNADKEAASHNTVFTAPQRAYDTAVNKSAPSAKP